MLKKIFKKGSSSLLLVFIFPFSVCTGSTFILEGFSEGKKAGSEAVKVQPVVAMTAEPFDLKQVRLLDGPFKDAQEIMHKFLLELENDRLLHMFRVNASLPSNAEPLGGWESPDTELRGHSMGHYLSACAMMYAATGDEKLKEKAENIVSELAKCQAALGNSGYLSAYPESFIDRVEKGERVWAPYYTLHKIFAGLIDMYVYCGSREALQVAEGMARWVKGRTDKLTTEQMQLMLNQTEQGGMNEALCNLYAVTGNEAYLTTARRFDQNSYTEPLYRHEDNMTGQHVNSFIPNIVGSAREYELTGNKKEYEIATYFWDQVGNHRSYATGGTSNFEGWQTKADILADQLSSNSHETCCTYNILKLTRHLFIWEPKAEYADFYERGLYNGILSTINPADAMTMYYVPMLSGLYKTFSTPRNSFWCCTGTGMENPAKYGDSIYFHNDKGIFVNLFIASEVDWKDKGVVLRQETRFPEQEGTSLIIKTAKQIHMPLYIRIPYWAGKGVKVKINGKEQAVKAEPSSYVTLERTFKDGDRVDIEMPMSLHLHRMPDDGSIFAIMYGPLVLAGEMGLEQLPPDKQYGAYGPSGKPVEVPDFVGIEGKDINDWIKPFETAPLKFRTLNAGRPRDVILWPFYKLFGQRYGIYWKSYTDGQWKERLEKLEKEKAALQEIQSRKVDEIIIGSDSVTDSEINHNFEGENVSRGSYLQRSWIQADPNGWFGYKMKVLRDNPVCLVLTYWGADTGDRKFDIIVEDKVITTQRIHELSPGQFIDIEYLIPKEHTTGRDFVRVKFKPHQKNTAGGIFGVAILKAKNQ